MFLNELFPVYLTRNTYAEPNYKYVEVVRKKDERAKLNGYKCRDCQEVMYMDYSKKPHK